MMDRPFCLEDVQIFYWEQRSKKEYVMNGFLLRRVNLNTYAWREGEQEGLRKIGGFADFKKELCGKF